MTVICKRTTKQASKSELTTAISSRSMFKIKNELSSPAKDLYSEMCICSTYDVHSLYLTSLEFVLT